MRNLLCVILLATGILSWLLDVLENLCLSFADQPYLLWHLSNSQVAEIFRTAVVWDVMNFTAIQTNRYLRL
jgi:hypothetical protein